MDCVCPGDFSTQHNQNEEVATTIASVPKEIESIEDATKAVSEIENEEMIPEIASDSLRVTLRRLDKDFQVVNLYCCLLSLYATLSLRGV